MNHEAQTTVRTPTGGLRRFVYGRIVCTTFAVGMGGLPGERLERFCTGVARWVFGRAVPWGIALLAAVAMADAEADALPRLEPSWHVPEAEIRVVFPFTPSPGATWVRLPLRFDDGRVVEVVRAVAADAPCPVRIWGSDGADLCVELDVSGLAAGDVVAVYGVAGAASAETGGVWTDPPDFPVDESPIRVNVSRVLGQDPADTWARMRWIWDRRDPPPTRFSLPALQDVDGGRNQAPHWERAHRTRRYYVAKLRWHRRFEADRRGQPAVQTRNPTFLLLDGTPVLQYPAAFSNHQGWALSDPVDVPAGVRDFEVYHVCQRHLQLRVGWLWEGETEVEPLDEGVLLPGDDPVAVRLERIEALLHPAAQVESRPPYRIYGLDTDFRPVTLRDESVSWAGRPVWREWWHDGVMLGAEPTQHHVFQGLGPHRVELQVTDSLGFRARLDLDIARAPSVHAEYRLAADWQGLPVVAFGNDIVRPELWLRGNLPEAMRMDARIVRTDADGETVTQASSLALRDTWTRMELPPLTVGGFETVDWELRHAGVLWRRGRLRRVAPPFTAFPDAVHGDALVGGGEQWVLAPRHGRDSLRTPRPLARNACLLWIDSTVIPEGYAAWAFLEPGSASLPVHLEEASGATEVAYVHWDDLATGTAGAGVAEFLVGLGGLDVRDGVILSLGFEALQTGEAPAAFQRRLAAAVGLLRDVREVPLLLVTPLPYERDGRVDVMRPYAEAVHRVADAHGVAVADLYTTFRALEAEAPASVLRDLHLTDAGRRRLVERLAQALSDDGANPPAGAGE